MLATVSCQLVPVLSSPVTSGHRENQWRHGKKNREGRQLPPPSKFLSLSTKIFSCWKLFFQDYTILGWKSPMLVKFRRKIKIWSTHNLICRICCCLSENSAKNPTNCHLPLFWTLNADGENPLYAITPSLGDYWQLVSSSSSSSSSQGLKKFLCFRLLSGEKVGTGRGGANNFIIIFIFVLGAPCNITQPLIKTNWRTEQYPWEPK